MHLDRLTGVITSAARHGDRAQVLHERAGMRIDAALYELEQLRLELQAVTAPPPMERTQAAGPSAVPAKSGTPPAATELEAGPVRAAPAGSKRSAA